MTAAREIPLRAPPYADFPAHMRISITHYSERNANYITLRYTYPQSRP